LAVKEGDTVKKWLSFWGNLKNRLFSSLKPSKEQKKETLRKTEKKERTTPKGIVEWMEKTGVSLQELAQMTGYDKSTIWHALNDKNYRRRLSPRFWGKLGAAIRRKVKPKWEELERAQKRVVRCPRCKAFFILEDYTEGEQNVNTDTAWETG
jgi:lambda repressor-like predicted transcriptional regulator